MSEENEWNRRVIVVRFVRTHLSVTAVEELFSFSWYKGGRHLHRVIYALLLGRSAEGKKNLFLISWFSTAFSSK